MTARVHVVGFEGASVVTLTGELDRSAAHDLERALVGIQRGRDAGPVVVDVSEASFLGASCLRAIVAASERSAAGRSGGFALVADPNGPVMRSIELVGAGDRLEVYASLDVALTMARASRS